MTATESDTDRGRTPGSDAADDVPEQPEPAESATVAWPGLEPATAALAGWALQAVLAVVVSLITRDLPSGGLGQRLYQLAYEASHLLALGALSFWLVAAWRRWGPKRVPWSLVGVGILSWVVALSTTQDDFANWMERHDIQSPLVFPALALVPALAVTATMLGVLWSRSRLWLRGIMLAVALTLSLANHRVLPLDYAGMHLFWAWIAALLVAGVVLPVGPRALPTLAVRRAIGIGCGVVGLLSLLVTPPRAVRTQLLLSTGAVVAPFVTQLWPTEGSQLPPLPIQASPWFSNRTEAPPRPPGPPLSLPQDKLVLFITIDAVRADVVADESYRAAVPLLHRLKSESLNFTMARAAAPATATSLTAMFVGKYYSSTYWSKVGSVVTPRKDATPRLGELLKRGGVSSTFVNPLWGRKYERRGKRPRGYGFERRLNTKHKFGPAPELVDLLLDELQRKSGGPRFIYVHFVDPHAPYKPTRKGGEPFDGYLAEISAVDRELKRVVDYLESSGLAERTVLIVGADHGEAFGEHGYKFHAYCVYEEVVRIPLMVKGPGIRPRVVDTPVTLMDIMPTVLDLFGVETPGYAMGESLVPFLRGETPALTRPIAVDSGRRMQALYFPNGYKVITDLKRGTVEVYDLKTDPEEAWDISERGPEVERIIAAQRAFFQEHTLKRPGWKPPWRKF